MKKKIWAMLVHLGTDLWEEKFCYDEVAFDDELWESILKQSADAGINMIVLDLANAVEYGSHPEIAKNGAWTRKRVRDEVKRCKEMGIALIPKLNFATPHCKWMGKYSRMISTPEYYQVCNDLIKEVYNL
ncbi:MAG: Tat pathway signal protein, partial [Clostridia bacterium]|nr:Tat pathway signal protein [Clostridia bacterium]